MRSRLAVAFCEPASPGLRCTRQRLAGSGFECGSRAREGTLPASVYDPSYVQYAEHHLPGRPAPCETRISVS